MDQSKPICPLCALDANVNVTPISACGVWFVNCKRCGQYNISDEAMGELGQESPINTKRKYQLSGVVREHSDTIGSSDALEILTTTIENLLTRSPDVFDIPSRARKLLAAIARKTHYAGQIVHLYPAQHYPLAFGPPANFGDINYIFNYLKSEKWVDRINLANGEEQITITPKGWEELSHVDKLSSHKAFIAMWFDSEVDAAFKNGIKPAIESCGYQPVRIDTEEYNGDIVDQVLAEIKESRFVVSDLTGHRNGVYFEGGFAMGMDLPVIWTCRDSDGGGTHFDAEHLNQIRWNTPEELCEKLRNRIRATIGYGPLTVAPAP